MEIENMDLIRAFVGQSLGKEINILESRRKSYYKHSRYAIFFGVSLLVHLPVFFIPDNAVRSITHQFVLLVNLVSSYFAFFRYKNDDRLYFDYRKRIIPTLLRKINDRYRYIPRAKIHAKEFASSGLYYSKLSKLTRSDLILGLYNKAAFSMSYVKAQSRDFAGNSTVTEASDTSLITRFQGLHYVFKVPLLFKGRTMILPLIKTNVGEVDEINQFNLKSRIANRSTKRIVTGNVEFDNSFAVFTSFESEARNFLSSKRVRDILQVNNLFRNSVALSFFGSFVFLQVHTNREVFKVDINKPINTDQVTENYLNLKIALQAIPVLLS